MHFACLHCNNLAYKYIFENEAFPNMVVQQRLYVDVVRCRKFLTCLSDILQVPSGCSHIYSGCTHCHPPGNGPKRTPGLKYKTK